MPALKRRTVGSLSHADFGSLIDIPGYGRGILWSVQHTGVMGDIREPWTRLIFMRNGASEGTRGLPPGTAVTITAAKEG